MKKSLLMLVIVALSGCEAMLAAAIAPALPVLIPMALIVENVDYPDRTTQPVMVETSSGQILATPAEGVAIETTFTVTRQTITCESTGETSRFGMSVTKMVTCSDGRKGTFSNGDPLSRYKPMRLRLGEEMFQQMAETNPAVWLGEKPDTLYP